MFEGEPIIENELENFYEEIQALKEEEAESKDSFHLTDLDPYNLTKGDMEMYKRFKTVDRSNIEEVADEFKEYRNGLQELENEDSKSFAGYLGNKIILKLNEDLLKENGK